jgi:microsomal dipeptidase-like Zn-dependent dipeptidase
LFIALIRMHETHLALAAERSWVVETLAVLTQGGIVGAFVNVLTDVAVPAESRVADALKQQTKMYRLTSKMKFSLNYTLKDPSVLMHWAS